jgi:hypothetical protein
MTELGGARNGRAGRNIAAPRPYVSAFTGIYAVFELFALPLLRLTMGLVLVPHDCQKLFGWFGGASRGLLAS